MNRQPEVFRRRWLEWSIPLAFLALNLGVFALLHTGIAGRAQSLRRQLDEEKRSAAASSAERAQLEGLLAGSKAAREATDRLYREQFSTESDRLTLVIWEVKQLAGRSGLDLRAISYPEDSIEDYDLVRRSFVFSVAGTYANLREFLHLVELSSSFPTVNQIKVDTSEREGDRLNLAIRLSTIFVAPRGSAAAAPAAPREGRPRS